MSAQRGLEQSPGLPRGHVGTVHGQRAPLGGGQGHLPAQLWPHRLPWGPTCGLWHPCFDLSWGHPGVCVPLLGTCLPGCGPGEPGVWLPSGPLGSGLPCPPRAWPRVPGARDLWGPCWGGGLGSKALPPCLGPSKELEGPRQSFRLPRPPAAQPGACTQRLLGMRVLFRCDGHELPPQLGSPEVLSSWTTWLQFIPRQIVSVE